MLCRRCAVHYTYGGRLICPSCLKERKIKPLKKAWQKPVPPSRLVDWWQVAQDGLYPNRTYHSLTKEERYRVMLVCTELAGVPHREPVPVLDEESRSLVTGVLALKAKGYTFKAHERRPDTEETDEAPSAAEASGDWTRATPNAGGTGDDSDGNPGWSR